MHSKTRRQKNPEMWDININKGGSLMGEPKGSAALQKTGGVKGWKKFRSGAY